MAPRCRYSREDVERELPLARSYRNLLGRLGMCMEGGGNVYHLRRKVAVWGLNDKHFTGQGWLKGKKHSFSPLVALDAILVENSSYARQHLKKRLIKLDLLKEECGVCQIGPVWRATRLVLVLDHINGVRDDNRLENLRLLCPNCNSQQPTFAGRNNRLPKPAKVARRKSKYKAIFPRTRNVKPRPEKRRVVRPNLETLMHETEKFGFSATGRKYGVSDNAVRKWIKVYEKYGS